MAEIKDNPIINSIAQAGQAQAASQNAALAIHQQLDQEDMASSAAVIARSAMGNAEATMSSEKNAWEAASDSKVAETRAFMGADPTLQGSLSNKWLQRMNEAAEKQYQSLDVIQEKQSKTLLNDPLGFIAAQFTLPADIATHNYYNQQRATAEEQLNEITSASDANVIAVQRAKQHTSTEYAIAESEKAKQGAEFDNARLIADNAGKQITGLNDLNSLTQQQLNVAFQKHAAANSDAALEMQRQNHADMMELRQARLEAQKDKEESDALDMQAYNAGQKKLGKPTIDDPRMFRSVYKNGFNRDPNFMNTLGLGQSLLANGGVTNGVAVAGSAGEAATLYATGATNNLNTLPVGKFLATQFNTVKAMPNAPKDHVALVGLTTERAVNEANNQLRDIQTGSIYAAPPPSVILAARGLDNDPFLDGVVRPLVDKDPNVKIDDATLVGKAMDFAKTNQGGINSAAVGVAQYFKMAVLKNNLLNQYTENGLPAQAKQYNARINGAIVNLADPIEVKKAIIQQNIPRFDSPFGSR